MKEINQELIEFVRSRYFKKFPDHSEVNFKVDYEAYESVPLFKACENIHEITTDHNVDDDTLAGPEKSYVNSNQELKPEVHWIMRMVSQYYMTKVFEAMKIDLNDPNTAEASLGKGTPGRICKMFLGDNPEDTSELGSGRWNKEPFISRFPNTDKGRSVITKTVDIVSCCSHHFLPFTSLEGGHVVISYIPNKYVLGISKLQRFVTWASRRFWLQEDLTRYIGETIKRIAETEDVCVIMTGIVHGCERYRGANSRDGSLDTEYRSGYFK